MTHVVLLGDSVFDNAAYVAKGQEVVERLRNRLPAGWRATLNARDGAVIADVHGQLERLPRDAGHLVISAGGNDGLRNLRVLDERVASVAEALLKLADVRRRFRQQYRKMLDDALRLDLPTAVCTIYDARFPDPMGRAANTGLAVLNDVITREAAERALPLLDLRVLLAEDADYANAIEPSAQGGEKLARAILQLVTHHDFAEKTARIFARADAP